MQVFEPITPHFYEISIYDYTDQDGVWSAVPGTDPSPESGGLYLSFRERGSVGSCSAARDFALDSVPFRERQRVWLDAPGWPGDEDTPAE